jgi:arylsulfatase
MGGQIIPGGYAMKNVLIFCADHMRGDALACNGNSFVQTPNLDALAESGVTFRRCYTPNPICVPARGAITTGNYSHVCTNSKNNGGRIHDDQDKIAQVYADAGYETYAMGKLHYTPYSPPGQPRLLHGFQHAELAEEGRAVAQFDPECKTRGIEEYHDYLADVGYAGFARAHGLGNNDLHMCASPLPAEHHVDSWVASRTIAHLEAHLDKRKDKPFFMFSSFTKPHPPYDPPRPYDSLYDPRDIPAPFGSREDLDTRSPIIKVEALGHGIQFMSPEAIQVMRAYYYGLVTFQDAMIGRVMAFLQERGLLEDTIIVYTADHGDMLGDFGGVFKCNMMEGSCRIPMIVSAPGQIPASAPSDDLVGLQDILPTVASLTGHELNHPTQGLDLTSSLMGNGPVREAIYSNCRSTPWQTAMVTDARWKYAYCEANGYEELYDMANDPTELRNLIAENACPEEAARMRQLLISQARELKDTKILDGDDLKCTEVDVDSEAVFSEGRMGWRWY